jgi:hypothetical protein
MDLSEILKNICALQPKYSSSNTLEMQERGRLIRDELANAIRDNLPVLKKYVDNKIDDLAVEGSDGIGRKTEAPWVRLYSKGLSPNPREGFYLVIHFAANGTAVFITVGCGSTIWSGGDLRPVSDSELILKTSWARSVIQKRWGNIEPFTDQIDLGAKAPLPKTFEKATAFAKRVLVEDLKNDKLDNLLISATERLGEIYLAQLDKRDISPGDQDIDEIANIAKPLRRKSSGQGIGLSASERKLIEVHAMDMALSYLKKEGFVCNDTSATEPFDILATKNNTIVKVEVKGTTSDICNSVLMTRNEVNLHQKEKGLTGLIIVSNIKLIRDEIITTNGGKLEALLGWNIDEWITEPVAFQVSRS